MTFLDKDWRFITIGSYTAWAFYALALLTLAPDIIYGVLKVDTNPRVWTCLQLIVCIAGFLGRLILQPKENRFRRRAIIAAVLVVLAFVSVPALAESEPPGRAISQSDYHTYKREAFDAAAFKLIARWEGKRNESYQDIVGVWTICYGHTATAAPYQYKTDAECAALLVLEIREYRSGLYAHFKTDTKRLRLPVHRDAAFTSLAYNVGIKGAGRSTAVRRLNAGKIAPACEALTWWNKAGGRVVRGLVRRRSAEREYCLRGLA